MLQTIFLGVNIQQTLQHLQILQILFVNDQVLIYYKERESGGEERN